MVQNNCRSSRRSGTLQKAYVTIKSMVGGMLWRDIAKERKKMYAILKRNFLHLTMELEAKDEDRSDNDNSIMF
jgi:hypothetical protein